MANGRQPWFPTSCCPTNVARTLSSLEHYFTTSSADGLQVHQYAPMRVRTTVAGEPVELDVATEYPWDGTVEFEVRAAAPAAPWTLSLRIPAWAAGAELAVNGQPAGEGPEPGRYAQIHRQWSPGDVVTLTLPMPPRLTRPDERIDAVRGCLAIERGPLVYCLEQVDQPDGALVDRVRIEDGPGREVLRAVAEPDLLGGITVVEAPGRTSATGEPVTLRAVPYFTWANRELGAMRVWIPEA